MNRLLMLLLLVGALALTSCKTNEKNMYDAYEKAIKGQEELDLGDQTTIYTQARREMKHSTMVVGKDTLDVSSQWVKITEKGGGINENLKRYCVVVGQFKLEFNAVSMRDRIVEHGYPGAFVVETREPYYFVVAASFSDIAPARDLIAKVRKDKLFQFKSPLPFILKPSQIR